MACYHGNRVGIYLKASTSSSIFFHLWLETSSRISSENVGFFGSEKHEYYYEIGQEKRKERWKLPCASTVVLLAKEERYEDHLGV